MKRAKRMPAWLARRGFTARTKARIAAALERSRPDQDGPDPEKPAGNTVPYEEVQRLRAARNAPAGSSAPAGAVVRAGGALRRIG
ncbi:hypothetical protein [Methylobacterium oxalidis]|nr:hypothetical protein [Methylobacterium oxalidis]GJE32035.1 hypothetical protein LDDCCGHA_2217 [Methylobacterium oxalidis]GLS67900.1 hypothetical protein GCM10007888_62850 [Methylobacterium oxalidis]